MPVPGKSLAAGLAAQACLPDAQIRLYPSATRVAENGTEQALLNRIVATINRCPIHGCGPVFALSPARDGAYFPQPGESTPLHYRSTRVNDRFYVPGPGPERRRFG